MTKLFTSTSIAFCSLILLINGIESKPTDSSRYCRACNNLANFTRTLKNSEGNGDDQTFMNSLIKWCIQSGNGGRQMCTYLAKSLTPIVDKVIEDGFCVRAGACNNELIVDDNAGVEQVSNSSDVNCAFCMNTFTHLKEIISSKETEDEIKFILSKTCDYLGNFKAECIKMWDQNLDDIFEFLRNALQPKQICDALGLCLNQLNSISKEAPEIEEVINIGPVKFEEHKLENPIECMLCKKIFLYVYNYIANNRSEEAIKEALDKVCDTVFTGLTQKKCEKFVNKHYMQIVDAIKLATEPELACTVLQVCTKVEVKITPNCLICKNVFKYIYDRLKDNRTEERIREELDQVCDYILPQPQRAKCENMVDQYTEEIIELIMEMETPEKACQALGLCKKNLVRIPLTKIMPAIPIGIKAVIGGTVESGPACDLCRQIFGAIYQMVENKKTREEIEAALEKVCDLIAPGDKKAQCKDFVVKNFERIIELIAQSVIPDKACSILHLCNYNDYGHIKWNPVERKHQIKWNPVERNEDGDQSKWNPVERKEGDYIKWNPVDPFNGEESKEEVDDNREPYNPAYQPKLPKDETLCYTCQLAAHFVQEQLYSNVTEQEINTFIEKHFCRLLRNYGINVPYDECVEFVEKYGAMIEQRFAQEYFDPSKLCYDDLNVCKRKSAPKEPQTDIEFELVKPSKRKFCQTCIDAVNRLDEVLAEIPVEKDIKMIAEKACRPLPTDEYDECKKIIETFGTYLMQLIGRLNDAQKVCHAVDLCMIPGQIHLLGAHKCTYGPTYWCHTDAHAAACKATDYCKANYWKPIVN